MSLETTVNTAIKTAMLNKQEVALRALRAIKSALLIAKTEKGATEILSEETEIKVLQKLIKQRKESAEIYQTQNRPDLYQIETDEAEVIEQYLPQQLSPKEIKLAITQIIQNLNITSIKEMGKVMAAANVQMAGKADGKTISEAIKAILK
ncbi:MAG: GatB/YqeY domain-containing protein [Sphingobacteriales bacterium]|nr:MAG: GatB/YqeY domain-containing protein [Sphingobacteriales bacterium]TAF82701.1 MAG: GatB/YqeY domain-containing protein [Sphingobacteriales bacterium]